MKYKIEMTVENLDINNSNEEFSRDEIEEDLKEFMTCELNCKINEFKIEEIN